MLADEVKTYLGLEECLASPEDGPCPLCSSGTTQVFRIEAQFSPDGAVGRQVWCAGCGLGSRARFYSIGVPRPPLAEDADLGELWKEHQTIDRRRS